MNGQYPTVEEQMEMAKRRSEATFAGARGSASLRELLKAIEEFRKHAMYPYPDCSDEKKIAFIKASEQLDAAVRLNDQAQRAAQT